MQRTAWPGDNARRLLRLGIALAAFLTPEPSLARAETPDDVALARDLMIPMRDGVKLAADVYRPARSGVPIEGRFPALLMRTPYDKEVRAAPFAQYFASRGYVVVVQDVRSCYKSQGPGGPAEPRGGRACRQRSGCGAHACRSRQPCARIRACLALAPRRHPPQVRARLRKVAGGCDESRGRRPGVQGDGGRGRRSPGRLQGHSRLPRHRLVRFLGAAGGEPQLCRPARPQEEPAAPDCRTLDS